MVAEGIGVPSMQPIKLVALLAALVAVAAWLSSGSPAAASWGACQASAAALNDASQDGAALAPGGALSTPLEIEISCDLPTEVDVRLPGGDTLGHMVKTEAPLRLTGERAYLCHGQEARIEVASVALHWSTSVPISGINGVPRCDVMLKAGDTWLEWTGPRLSLRDAFAGRALGWVGWERGAGGAVPGLTVWAFVEEGPLSMRGWGEGLPPAMQGLTHFAPGHRYIVSSNVERAWTFPQPPSDRSVFEDAQVVSFYGFPGIPAMGVLGFDEPGEVAKEIADWAARYDRLNGPREVIPAFHLITGVAQRYPTRDGTWLSRLSHEVIAEYVEAAREREMLLFLDVQIGWSDPLREVQLLEEFLREPFVHMALDPEFATEHLGVRPGLAIGGVDAEEVNQVQRYLATLVEEENLPPKVLMVHQFAAKMLRSRADVEDVEGVELSIDMDGFGNIGLKLRHYDWYALREPSERPALKLFFNQDTPVMTPEQVQALDQAPDLIMYQ